MKLRKNVALGLVVIGLAGAAVWMMQPEPAPQGGAAMVAVTMPQLTAAQQAGQTGFAENCAGCHGENATGQLGVAPQLIHKIYEPSHHGDMSFYLAARRGVVAHHWQFGNMPVIEGISDQEIINIIDFIRAVQRANGIH